MPGTPGFHHLHLKSRDPDAAIAWYTRQFPTTSKGEWGGHKALKSPNNVLILFDEIDHQPAMSPPSAIWHFGWHVEDSRAWVAVHKDRPEVKMLPLYTTEAGGSVLLSSDTWPHAPGGIGRTRAQIEEAQKGGLGAAGGGGFAYFEGPDAALIEIAGDYDQERFNHVHMWHEDPVAALAWYQKHLNAPIRPGFKAPDGAVKRDPERSWPALKREGMFRSPRAGVEFGDVVLTWYPNQWDRPLVPSRGQLQDHIGLSVGDLDAWIEKLRGEGVAIVEGPYRLADTRAVMIEGASRESIELVEAR